MRVTTLGEVCRPMCVCYPFIVCVYEDGRVVLCKQCKGEEIVYVGQKKEGGACVGERENGTGT